MYEGREVIVANGPNTARLLHRTGKPQCEECSDPKTQWWVIKYDDGDIGVWPETLLHPAYRIEQIGHPSSWEYEAARQFTRGIRTIDQKLYCYSRLIRYGWETFFRYADTYDYRLHTECELQKVKERALISSVTAYMRYPRKTEKEKQEFEKKVSRFNYDEEREGLENRRLQDAKEEK